MKAFDYLAVRLAVMLFPLMPLALTAAHVARFDWVFG